MPGSPLPSHNRTRLARRWRQRDVSTRPVHLVSHVHVQLAFHADTLHRVTQPWSCTNERVAWADGNSTATMFVEHGLSRVETADLVLRQRVTGDLDARFGIESSQASRAIEQFGGHRRDLLHQLACARRAGRAPRRRP